MDYLALYRKYRPKKLDEVVGQEEIKQILSSSIINGTITHAYLFSGPRGTGKTTMAKILAKMVNCESPVDGNPCGKCDNCKKIDYSSDIIEIDAASNNGVDEIRDLREKANLVPSNLKYKVYIIDEVHMLTTQAFNALLKTLEEPPKHVIFILATTEYYKIPLTIASRCQKFQFTKLSIDNIVSRLREIASLEKIAITDDALNEIAKVSDGGMRDSINFLDQIRSFNVDEISISDVYQVCGSVPFDDIYNLLVNLKNEKTIEIIEFFNKIDVNGVNYSKFLEDFVSVLRDVILCVKNVDVKYVRFDIEKIKLLTNLYNLSDILYLVEVVNDIIEKLRNVSRQSMFVSSNFLLLMDKLKKYNDECKIEKSDVKYDMAFDFNDINDKKNEIETVENLTSKIIKDKNSKSAKESKQHTEIIINNAFAVADKNIKKQLKELFNKREEYLTDKKYSIAAGIFMDINIEVAGDNYIIFAGKNKGIVEKVYDNYELCRSFLIKILEQEYNFCVITATEWLKYRDEYIKNIHDGKKYELIELNNILTKEEKKETTVVDRLFDLIGEENVEFK